VTDVVVTGVVVTGFAAVRAPSLEALPEPVRARASRAERVTQLAFSAAGPALAMAGLDVVEGDPRSRMGIVLGTAFGCFLTNAAFERRFAEGGPAAASPRLFAATVSNAAAGELAIAYRLGGPSITLTAGGVAGLVAIGHAADVLRAGQADVLLAGGMDAAGEALDRWIDGGGVSFDGRPGEGAAIVVLERAEHAAQRGARVFCTIAGCAAGFETKPPDEDAVPDAGRLALEEAGLPQAVPPAHLAWARSWSSNLEGSIHSLVAGNVPVPMRPLAGGTFAATGVAGMLATIDVLQAGQVGLVVDRCNSGHVAAVAIRKPR
jgi:3-oxoacyl-[acyl-carrier-protein] synthase II